jgi:hypothetical protein
MLTKKTHWPIDRAAPRRLSDHETHVHVIQVDSERAANLESALNLEQANNRMLQGALVTVQQNVSCLRRLLRLHQSRSTN